MISLWNSVTLRKHSYLPLTENIETDILIIGGGITGLTAAYELAKAKKKVILIEAHQIGSGTTSYSTGNLYVPVQNFYQSIEKKWGINVAKTIAHSRQFAIDYIEKTILDNNIKCQFSRRSWYAYAQDNTALLTQEYHCLQKMNIAVEQVKHLPLELKFDQAIMLPNQARFNPLAYTLALAEKVRQLGGLIFENTCAIKIEEEKICTVQTPKAQIKAQQIFIATHTPLGINSIHLFTAPYRSYVIAASLKNHHYPEGQFLNIDQPKHILCTHAISKDEPELLLIAGNHHKTGQEKAINHFEQLQSLLHKHLAINEILYKWSAQHYQSADDIPYIGYANSSTNCTYLATGYFADGLVYGTLAGIIIADALCNRSNSLFKTYHTPRHSLSASIAFLIKENSNVFMQYLRDLPLFCSSHFADIKQGEGKIVEVNQEKFAVSRDIEEQLHIVSAVCPHMKGIVNWNQIEKTWDCPCHGSRFNHRGELLEGPAMANLKYFDSLDK